MVCDICGSSLNRHLMLGHRFTPRIPDPNQAMLFPYENPIAFDPELWKKTTIPGEVLSED